MNLAPVLDDADELENEAETNGKRASVEDESKSAAKSLSRAVPVARTPDPSVPLSNFGGVPENATHWRIRRRVLGGGWEHLSHAENGSIAAVSVWPLSELSEELLQARWGAGRYEVQWVKPMPGGGSRVLRGARQIDILPPASPAPAAPPPSAGVTFGPEVDRTLQMMRMITTEADAKMSSVLQFAAALAGRQNNGFGAAELELIMRNNREATAAAVAAAVAPIQAELASLRRELDAEDADEDGTGLAGAAASAAASAGMLKGKGAWVQAANFAAGNPELVKAALPIVADTLGKIASIFMPAQPPKERPRAVPQVVQAPPPPPVVAAPPPPPPVVAPPAPPPVVAAPSTPLAAEPSPALVFLDAAAAGPS